MRYIITILVLLSGYILTFAQKDTTSLCAVLEDQPFNRVDEDYQNPINVYWKDIKTVVHVHYSIYDSWAEIPEEHVYNAIDNLNEQFEEYMFNFDLIQIRYHDMLDGTKMVLNWLQVLNVSLTAQPLWLDMLGIKLGM